MTYPLNEAAVEPAGPGGDAPTEVGEPPPPGLPAGMEPVDELLTHPVVVESPPELGEPPAGMLPGAATEVGAPAVPGRHGTANAPMDVGQPPPTGLPMGMVTIDEG